MKSINLEHPCFPQPKDKSVKVWRYMNLAKLLNMLTTESLYLARLDLLGDPHEGSIPKVFSISNSNNNSSEKQEYNLRIRKSLFVNCWRFGDYESEAMWKLYCLNSDGIAIQTNYKKLSDSIDDDEVFMGLVNYIDYDLTPFKPGNVMQPAMFKRKAFEHENEIRIIRIDSRYWNKSTLHLAPSVPPDGYQLKWNIAHAIETIYINPYSPEWYFETVKALLEKFDYKIELKWSNIKSDPFYY